MKKLDIKSYDRAIELAGIILGLYLIRGIWTLSGFWDIHEYFRFEALRLLFTTILLIKILGFIKKKMPDQPKVQGLLKAIRIGEGAQRIILILATGAVGINYNIQNMIISVGLVLVYIYSLIILLQSKYNHIDKVKHFRLFVFSVLCVDSMFITLGMVMAVTKWEGVIPTQYFLSCIPILCLIWYLKKIQKLENQPPITETQDWPPE